ncbi:hypothetical protein [Planctomicrobium piriforme]|uniref:Uncharacterized protein n=1 Tax=Planctomicrobium piriforme TaxID=1576369 RepID=A0A1I3RA63_9PLAN|nr:hypothetical protein [Planctomicrobium piriforme]SFJ43544.1 hypothetical protein SAMN05421753_12074 [Planctomicrobium piriforme]
MDPDKYQQAWQAQSARTQMTVDADLLLKEVQRNQHHFRAIIIRRDFVEVGVALLLLPLWIFLGIKISTPWTWYLAIPALAWIAGFMLWFRMRHPQVPSAPDQPLLLCVKNSLTQVEDQIWLLRNVFWWYLLPPGISILAFFAHVTLLTSQTWVEAFCAGGLLFGFLVGVYGFIDYINQRAVSLDLEPRRQELLALLTRLGDEPIEEGVTTSATWRAEISSVFKRWFICAVVCFAILIVIVVTRTNTGSTNVESDRKSETQNLVHTAIDAVMCELV